MTLPLYGKTEFSLEEFEVAPALAKWEARRRKVFRLCFTGKDASPAFIADQLGLKQSTVKAIMAQPQFQEHMRRALQMEMTAVLPRAMSTLIEMMAEEKPDAIRMKAAMWMIERSDQLQKEVLKKQAPKKLPDESQIEALAKKIREKRLAALNAKAVDAQVLNGGQAVEEVREGRGDAAPGAPPLGELGGEGGRDEQVVPGPVQEREDVEPGPVDEVV